MVIAMICASNYVPSTAIEVAGLPVELRFGAER